jgi:hypothetical protein
MALLYRIRRRASNENAKRSCFPVHASQKAGLFLEAGTGPPPGLAGKYLLKSKNF